VAFGAKDQQTVRALQEADSYPGSALVIAYSHCIAHGYDMAFGLRQQKLAMDSGVWPLYRYDPRRAARGEAPFQLDSDPPKVSALEYMRNESRFRLAEKGDSKRFEELVERARREAAERYELYRQLSAVKVRGGSWT
jgi:pyruvate-ferredoxin/flavodoxin oxidoreductase